MLFTSVRVLVITNLLTLLTLIMITVRENYPGRIYNRIIAPDPFGWDYRWNQSYYTYISAYPLYEKQKNIVMLGTSLTAYAEWHELLNRPDVAGRGIGGDITKGFLERLNYITALKPKIVFIEGGVNDIGHDIPQDSIIKNLETIVSTLQAQNIKPVITAVTLLAENYKNANISNHKIRQLNEQLLKLAQHYNTCFIDLNPYVSGPDFLNPQYALTDGVHFTDKTYSVWKCEVEKVLQHEKL